jgi:hypothetical protein
MGWNSGTKLAANLLNMVKARPALQHSPSSTDSTSETRSFTSQIFDLWHERLIPYFLVIFIFWLVCIVESIQKISGQDLDPRFWMALSIVVTIFGGIKVFRLRSQQPRRELPQDDRQIDQLVESIRSKGFVAYQETKEDGRNADCVVVGPSGVYVIETKMRNVFGSRAIDYRNENELILGGKISDNQPIKHVRAAADVVRDQLGQGLQKQYPVKPLVVFFGDWQVNQPALDLDVAVMTAADIETYFDRRPSTLVAEEIASICSCLER